MAPLLNYQKRSMDDHSDTDDNGDGEGVWSPDIEQCFREALLLFPPCGRRKHILPTEGGGKMYGRNELIARHIRMRTGKIRSRKQVSSHIQVLARRKAKAESGAPDSMAGSSAPAKTVGSGGSQVGLALGDNRNQLDTIGYCDIWLDRPIVTSKIRLVEFSAFIEHRQLAQPLSSDHLKSTLGPMTDMVLAANINHGQQANTSINPMLSGQAQQGLLMPVYEQSSQPARVPMVVNDPPLQQPTMSLNLASTTGHFSQQPNQAANTNSCQTLQQHQSNNHQHHLNTNHQHNHQSNQRGHGEANNFLLSTSSASSPMIHNYQPQAPTNVTSGFTRHSYVKIDYRMPHCRQSNKLERIDISQIQDKFPEIGGSEGLYQRGSPDAFFLIKFWADINNDFEYNIDDQNSYFGFSCHFETVDPLKNITCSTKACSYGLQVVEKVEKLHGAFNSTNGRYSYDINRSPMCEFMIQFIKKLRQLPRASQMNSVLENFSVLQVVTSESTSEILLCLAFVFEIGSAEQSDGSQHHVYQLTKD